MAGQLEMSLRLILYARSFLLWSSEQKPIGKQSQLFSKIKASDQASILKRWLPIFAVGM